MVPGARWRLQPLIGSWPSSAWSEMALAATKSRHLHVTSISLVVFCFPRVLFRKGHGNLGPCH